ncbi:MAG: TonB-dependent receptor, partial [Ignavibacteriales bacterium]|nr:TonB-dependent receptor [Ignavibacteriales bacterium]
NNNNAGLAGVYTTPQSIAANLNQVSYIDARIFAMDYWAPTVITRTMAGARFTHVLSPETFYEVSSSVFRTAYDTNPGRGRDNTRRYVFGNADSVDEAPFGFQPAPSTGIDGLRMSVGFSNSRDTSRVTVWTNRFDISSQVDRYDQVKAGAEFVYVDNNVNYGSVDIFLPSGRSRSSWHTFPKRAAAYIQDKIEFEGMVANIGVRFDYSYAGGYWYEYNPYDKAFTGDLSLGLDTLLVHVPTKKRVTVSPRLGVSFPVTEDSKLYFNYGHFRSMPTPENLFLIRRYSDNNQVTRLADPNAPLPKTVQYELGYDQNLFDQFLLHLAGYYKDVTDEPTLTEYISKDKKVDYSKTTPTFYEDIRGFEISLTKNRGDWITGFINYTYEVSSSGRFGWSVYYQNPFQQFQYETDPYNIENDLYQSKPVPAPYARANVSLFTPPDYGPALGGLKPLADWRLNLLGNWQAGSYFTWAGGGGTAIAGLKNNVQWRDYYNLDLRLSKALKIAGVNVEFFMDMTNVLNTKHFTTYGFKDGNDYSAYMRSLHLPAGIGDRLSYGNIPGDDRPGDYRNFGVEFVPIVYKTNADALSQDRNPVS